MQDSADRDQLAQMVLLGPVSIQTTLDAETLHERGYAGAQRSLAASLNRGADALGSQANPWTFDEPAEQALLFTPPGFANRNLLPMAFIRFASQELVDTLNGYLQPLSHDWVITSCSLDFFTFGFAAIRLDLSCRTPGSIGEKVAEVEKLSTQVAVGLYKLVEPVIRDYEYEASRVTPDAVLPVLTTNHRHEGLLWLHRILLLHTDNLTEVAMDARAIVPNVHEVLAFRDYQIVPGVDTSIICVRTGQEEGPDWIIRIFELAIAVFASLLQMDGWLFDQLNHIVLVSRNHRRADAAEAVRRAQSTFERVALHRTKVDSTVSFLGSASVAVWASRSRVSGLPQLDDSITRKVELLSRLAQTRHVSVEQAHANRLGRLALLFTIFSVASSGVALIDFMYGGAWLSASLSRGLVLIGMVLALVVATLLMIRESEVPRKPGDSTR